MAERSKIEWTNSTWNPARGCTKVSPGCAHCYAEAFAERFRGVPGHPFEKGFDLRLVPEKLYEPLRWRRPRLVFVNSMSDLFHESIPVDFIQQVFAVMAQAHWHTFQILTKRSRRLVEICGQLPWPSNVWMGVSIESAAYKRRALDLAKAPAAVRFLSLEPLLGPIPSLPLGGIGWVIVGGESGPRARPMEIAWARDIRDQCQRVGAAFYLKQLGGRQDKRGGDAALLDGRRWQQTPIMETVRPALYS
jgi:protein gp37